MAIYVSRQHPLAQVENPNITMLAEHRELVLSSYTQDSSAQYSPRCWLAPSYLMLLEMTLRGFGWAALPTWQVENFGHGQLVQLKLPNWPRHVQVDVIWSRHATLGPACSWLIDHISKP
jgi:DNA-binding transcriptional LysR family regulator